MLHRETYCTTTFSIHTKLILSYELLFIDMNIYLKLS